MRGEDIDILIVEDNSDDAELTLHAVRDGNKKIKLIHVWDGVEALKFIDGEEPYKNLNGVSLQLILLNLNLPKLNGLEVLEKIRMNEVTKTTPVVILSSSTDSVSITRAYQMGANSYVVKPSRFDTYMKMISSLAFYWSVINVRPDANIVLT
jgi:two-component system, response regulator